MSSEESGEEGDGEEVRRVMYVKVLPWRAAKVGRFLRKLDHKASKSKSHQSKQQTIPRVVGQYSTRLKPVGFSDEFFGYN